MKVTVLEISAQLENVTDLRVSGPEYQFHMKFKCINCGQITDKLMTFSENDKIPLSRANNFVNLIFKCKICDRSCNISIVQGSLKSYKIEYSGTFHPLVELVCRGCEPISFEPNGFFVCSAVGNSQEFSEVDLKELNWADYNEVSQESVAIYDFEWRFNTKKH